MQAWVSFARNGKPTLPGGGIWPPFMQSDLKIALFGGESVVEIVSAPRQQELAIGLSLSRSDWVYGQTSETRGRDVRARALDVSARAFKQRFP